MCKCFVSFSLFYILFSTAISAQQYAVSAIPDSLTKDARVVKRLDEITYEIKSPGKATVREHHVCTVMNESGDSYGGGYASGYGKFNSINYIDATLYDASGKQLKHVKKKDMTDESGNDEATLMTDERYKVYNFYCKNYPYTTEWDEEDEYNGIRDFPDWNPLENGGIAVQSSKYTLIAPKDYKVRFKEFNYPGQPVITANGDKTIYTWELKNVPAITKEPYEPALHDILPYVMMAPSEFEVEGYKGNMDDWKSFGIFINQLLQGKSALPDGIKQKVHELTDNVKDEKEKIKLLYNLLQQNTRYISVQLGIGGWQPFDANYVYTKKYGDCKALSNYMVALLKEAGINAKYVLINAGQNAAPLIADFSCSQFNHATVCVPMQKDTMWVECTSQTLPAGYIGDFTGNRQALLIDDDGGHVVWTKKYTANDNIIFTSVNGTIDESGKLNAKILNTYKGVEYEDIHMTINSLSKKDQLDELKKSISLPTYDVTDFSYDDHKTDDPSIDENIQVVADNYATVSGKRMFVTPNILSKSGYKLDANDKRKYDVVYPYSYRHIDTVNLAMPAGYTIEALPKNIEITNQFGKYSIHFTVAADKIVMTRLYERSSGRFPPSDYNTMVKFYNDIYKADHSKIVFVKKES
jgi:hypothetical protein